jgi:hypothetical protein
MRIREGTMRSAKERAVRHGFLAGSVLALFTVGCGQSGQAGDVFDVMSELISATWTAQGPAPILNGQENVQPASARNPAAGAVNSVVTQPGNANIIYVGTVNGGVWKTTNALAATPTWTPLTDFQASLSIGEIALDPGNTNNVVAGTGRWSSFGNDGNTQGLIYVSRNAGATFTQTTASPFGDQKVGGIAIRGNTILVTTPDFTGMARSTDSGATWTTVSGGAGTGLPAGSIFDLAEDGGNASRFYTTVNGVGVFRSTDQGATWVNVSQNNPSVDAAMRGGNSFARVSVSRNDGRLFVAVMDNGTGIVNFVAWSGNQGGTWTVMAPPNVGGNAIPFGMFAMAADPVNSSFVYVAVVGDWVRGDVGTGIWTTIAGSGTPNFTTPHADSRDIAFDANLDMILGEDGGVFKRPRPRETTGDWFSLAGNLGSAEVHNSAYDGNSRAVLAGTQDNGAVFQLVPGQLAGENVTFGDGGDVDVDTTSTPGFSFRYTSSQFLFGFRRREYDAANNFISEVFPALLKPDGSTLTSPFFVTPVEVNNVDGRRLVIAGGDTVYESLDQGEHVTPLGGAVGASDMVYGHPNNPNVIWAAAGQVWVRTAASGPLMLTASPFPDFALDVILDTSDFNNAYVMSQGQVFHTTNTGASWTNITGNLQSLNPSSLRTITFIHGNTRSMVVVGATNGVFATTTAALGTWQAVGTNLPHAPVLDSQFNATRNQLTVGTLGRGVWTAAGLAQ